MVRSTIFGLAVFAAATAILGNLRSAAAWGIAAGAIAGRGRPTLYFGWAVPFLLLVPLLGIMGLDRPAEDTAASALYLLTVGVCLELRQGASKAGLREPADVTDPDG